MTAIVTLSPATLELARAVQAAVPGSRIYGLQTRLQRGSVDVAFADTGAVLRQLFESGESLIGLFSSAIAIRCLAPVLADKTAEPPVLALAPDGTNVVPLLGGHRGANRLAHALAGTVGGHAAVTTASEAALGGALDDPPEGWRHAAGAPVKDVTGTRLAGSALQISSDGPVPAWLAESAGEPATDAPAATLRLTDRAEPPGVGRVVLHPQRLVVGVGCARGCPPEEAVAAVRAALAAQGLAEAAVAAVASLDLKLDEPAVHGVAEALGVPARFFTATELAAEEGRLLRPSPGVRATVGCAGVAEGAALALAGPAAELAVAKRSTARATVAVARAGEPVDPRRAGRARGVLSVVGLGPGSAARRTPAAQTALAEADSLVGYGGYLDLLGPWAAAKAQYRFPLGAERERVERAVAEAAAGQRVALVGSGDAGIYALASLVAETLEHADGETRRALAWHVEPGITAMQLAAARAGALLGHDFCAISLSDLLTPWATIDRRLHGAGAGDFVVALYNPSSQRRGANLTAARAILAGYRPADTPVVIARNLDRPGESVQLTTLGTFDEAQVDMLTVVLVGAAASRTVPAGPGEAFAYTPRGYGRGAPP